MGIILAVACGGGGGKGPSEEAEEGGKLQLGESVEVTSNVIDAGGGTITIDKDEDPLDGLQLTIPSGSYDDGRTFAISYRPITDHSYGDKINPASRCAWVP